VIAVIVMSITLMWVPKPQQAHGFSDLECKQSPDLVALVDNLGSDAVRYNCDQALRSLEECGPEVIPALERALGSADRQRRFAACALLANREDYKPSPQVLAVCVEALKDDEFPFDGESYTYIFNAARSTRFLVKHAAAAEPLLVQAMESTDLQQRFLAGVILGWSGRSGAAERVSAILIPHLRDNCIPCDSLLAGGALYRLGAPALPLVQAAMKSSVDVQQSEWLTLIAIDIQDPPTTGEKQWKRRTLHAVDHTWDPAVGYSLDSLKMNWGTMSEEKRDTPSNPAVFMKKRAHIIEMRDRWFTRAEPAANNRP
jgi:hypothetical protein